jgi:hypothetical protein
MTTLEGLRPEPQALDVEWSAATLQHIFASSDPAEARRRTKARRRVVAGVVAVAAAIAAIVVGSTTFGTSAAFAVEQDSNGDVIVTIHRLTDSAGLEKALGEHGIEARVSYVRTQVPSDLDDGSGPSACAADQRVGATVGPSDDGGFTVTFERAYLVEHRGAELSLTAAGGAAAGDWAGLRFEWSDGLC